MDAAARLVKFAPIKGYTQTELEVLAVAEFLVNDSIRNACVLRFMEARGIDRTGYKMISTNGLANADVLPSLYGKSFDVPLVMYYKNNSTVGYRNVGSPTIYTNRKFHAGATACARASNLGHEVLHVAGFGHTSNATKIRPYSVPYSYNAAIAACCTCRGVLNCEMKP